jgi:glycosyltransferase involved in cell wall biosynthesis
MNINLYEINGTHSKPNLVFMPNCNKAEYVVEALQSLNNQTVPVALAFQDDCSNDESGNIALEYLKNNKDGAIVAFDCMRLSKNVGIAKKSQ